MSESHPLAHSFTFYVIKRQATTRTNENYEKNIKKIASFSTVEEFWAFYNHLVRPGDLQFNADYHLFKTGLRPMWEDEDNKNGGRFMVRAVKGKRIASKWWEDLVLALIGNQFESDEEICGINVSTRSKEDVISIWTRNANNEDAKRKIKETLVRVLNLTPGYLVDYKPHVESQTKPAEAGATPAPGTAPQAN